jgi:two-component system, OmpR family, sensor histidine kinase MprB
VTTVRPPSAGWRGPVRRWRGLVRLRTVRLRTVRLRAVRLRRRVGPSPPVPGRREAAPRVRNRRGASLRARLVAAAALAVGIAVCGVAGVGYLLVRHELQGQLDRQLRGQAERIIRLQGVLVPPLRRFGDPNGYTQLVPAAGAPRVPVGQVGLPVTGADRAVAGGRQGPRYRDIQVAGAQVRMLTAPLSPGLAVQIALPREALDGQLRRLAVAFAALAGLGLAAAVGLAALVSRRALAPVGQLTDAAERIAATRDLTHRIGGGRRDELGRLAASFDSMLSALEQSAGAQRQLVADASHELRTPLASMRTNVELLDRLEELPPAARAQVLAAIVSELEELTGLVGDLVELARGEAQPRRLEEVPFDRIVVAAVARAARHWPAARFDVQAEPVAVCAEPARLDRAVANLLDNAAKFADGTAPRVEVRLTAAGVLTVRDHGPGVPAAAIPHVFDRFYRADQARALPGSGLGLAIVRQVAGSHGGSVTLANAESGGAVATLTLPALPR